MSKVSPSISDSTLTLRAPGMMSVSVDLAQLGGKIFRTAVWGQPVSACDCGEEVARWLSRYLLQEDTGLRLVYYPLDRSTRDVRTKNKAFPLIESSDSVSTFPHMNATCETVIPRVCWNVEAFPSIRCWDAYARARVSLVIISSNYFLRCLLLLNGWWSPVVS